MVTGEHMGGSFIELEGEMKPDLRVDITDLGPGNIGAFGPAGLDELERQRIVHSLGRSEFSLPASNTWICVDGRTCDEEVSQVGLSEFANPQIGGSLPVSETAADFMRDPSLQEALSARISKNTQAAIADGLRIILHGDEHTGKKGCAANAKLRDVLRFNAENADIVAPQVWVICKALGLDAWLNQDDILVAILNGKTAADNDALWDITPEEVVDVAVANGAEYQTLRGPHQEVTERVDLTDGAFDKVSFIKEQSTSERIIQAFSASFGKYKQEAFRRARLHGKTDREAALQTMKVKLFNVGLTKMLKTDEMEVGVVSRA